MDTMANANDATPESMLSERGQGNLGTPNESFLAFLEVCGTPLHADLYFCAGTMYICCYSCI